MSLISPHTPVTLAASAARTATGSGDELEIVLPDGRPLSLMQLILDVTAAATETGDTLDVFVQTQLDETNWVDVAHFTQVLGDGGAKRYFTKLTGPLATSEFENGTSLSAAAARNLLGRKWRARWAIADVSTDNASFTFSVVAVPA